MSLSFRKQKDQRGPVGSSQRGQIVVEYVLLLSIAVTIAMIIVSQLINRDQDDPDNSGAIIRKWQQMQDTIAKDVQN